MVDFMRDGAGKAKSCMSNDDFRIHPYNCFAAEFGWRMAIENKNGEFFARALVNTESKQYVRTFSILRDSSGYTQESKSMGPMLENMGYSRASGWQNGLKLARIEHECNELVGPYIDGYSDKLSDEGCYLRFSNHGEYCGDNTTGLLSGGECGQECEECGAHYDSENEGAYIEGFGLSVCDHCACHRFVYIDYNRYDYHIRTEDARYIDGRYVDPDNLPDDMTTDVDGDIILTDDAVYIESAGQYYPYGDSRIVLRADKEYDLTEDCFKCAECGEWFSNDDSVTLDDELHCAGCAEEFLTRDQLELFTCV